MPFRLNCKRLLAVRNRLDHYLKRVVHADANLAACHADDAGVAGPKHLNFGPPAESKFMQPVNSVRFALDVANFGGLSRMEVVDRNEIDHLLFIFVLMSG